STFPAQAETLQEALAAAYRDNPSLTAARAGQRATDEDFNIRKADGLPDVGVSSTYNEYVHDRPRPVNPLAPGRTLTTLLSVDVPVYSGGRVRNAVAGARQRVEAGQYDLRATELTVFAQVVAAYMDVIRAE